MQQPLGSDASDPLVVRLSLDRGPVLCGWVGVDGDDDQTPFHGWVELMSAIDVVRTAVPPHPGPAAA
jgi:hypothetical protein